MANRVVMDANGLKVSKPGVNVLTAGDDDLVFSSDWACFGVQLRGTQNINWPTPPLNEREISYSQNISLGNTFPQPPYAEVELNVNGTWRKVNNTDGNLLSVEKNIRIWTAISGGGAVWSRTAFWRLTVGITTTQLQIRGDADVGGILAQDRFQPPNLQIRYTVFTYPF